MAMEIIDDAIARYPVDRNRIYVMGISMGGYAAWELMQRRPELFAAGLPCCGGGDVAQALRLKDIAIWCSNGSSPNAVKRLYRRIFCQVFVRCETLLRSSVQP